ncbi:uncharacterized protein LOC142764961 isoform X2 [Rhipicephalus microplus]
MVVTLTTLAVVYWTLPCSPAENATNSSWKTMDPKDNATVLIAQQAMDFMSNEGLEYYYVLNVLSAKYMEDGKKKTYNMTYTYVTAYCSTYKPFVRDKCQPTEKLPSDQCTAVLSTQSDVQFTQVLAMECHEVEPHDSIAQI